jgi:hypothetical protein
VSQKLKLINWNELKNQNQQLKVKKNQTKKLKVSQSPRIAPI